MNKIDELKEKYEDIKAPEELKENIKKTINAEKKRKSPFKKYAGIAACVGITAIAALNVSPAIVYASADIPILGTIVKIVTFGRYEKQENGYEANIVTPQIEGLLDKNLQDKLNEEFKENANSVISAFEKDVKALKEEFGDKTVHMGIEYNYLVKTDSEDILALDVYMLNTAASSSTVHKFYTIDKKSGELLTLKGLFKEDTDYVSVLSNYIVEEMKRMNKEDGGMFWVDQEEAFEESFKSIKDDQNFYINDDGNIVVCFDKYEVAAGAQGSPEFVIPKDIVKDIIK